MIDWDDLDMHKDDEDYIESQNASNKSNSGAMLSGDAINIEQVY